MVRAKFKVDETSKNVYNEKVILSPVVSGSKENEDFFKTTPSGKIEMFVKNPEAMKQFVPGAEFYVDFSPVDTAGK
jgi:hypothetical protein